MTDFVIIDDPQKLIDIPVGTMDYRDNNFVYWNGSEWIPIKINRNPVVEGVIQTTVESCIDESKTDI